MLYTVRYQNNFVWRNLEMRVKILMLLSSPIRSIYHLSMIPMINKFDMIINYKNYFENLNV